jgi:hypothetical protein
VFDMPARMTAFLRRSDGALIVGAANGTSFISTDQGVTFVPWFNPPHLRALGERNGILYAVADNYLDGYAWVVRSTKARPGRACSNSSSSPARRTAVILHPSATARGRLSAGR